MARTWPWYGHHNTDSTPELTCPQDERASPLLAAHAAGTRKPRYHYSPFSHPNAVSVHHVLFGWGEEGGEGEMHCDQLDRTASTSIVHL